MRLAGAVSIVTGGGSGIGRALARRVAEEGAAGVLVADIDEQAAQATAAEIGERAVALGCDVSAEEQVRTMIERAEDAFGAVDVFFANAGVAIGTDEQTAEEVWERALGVNFRAHVLAARLLVPRWLERGSGCFVATASAAGLLTQIGSAPYAVTKHAAVAFAEWLSVTYGDRGIHVSCLCPQGVDTPMLRGPADADPIATAAADAVRASGEVLTPEEVAEAVVRALDAQQFLILPHPVVLEYFQRKASDYDRWLGGMRRLRRAVESAV